MMEFKSVYFYLNKLQLKSQLFLSLERILIQCLFLEIKRPIEIETLETSVSFIF